MASSLAPLIAAGSSLAGEFVDVEIEVPFREIVLADPALMSGLLDVRTIPGQGTFLVSVGGAANKALDSHDPEKVIATRRVAEAKAKQQIAAFVETSVESGTDLRTVEEAEVTSNADGSVERKRQVRRVLETWTRERSRALLRSVKPVGSWYSADRRFFYVLVAANIESPAD